MEISEKAKEWYRLTRGTTHFGSDIVRHDLVADFARDTLAEVMRLEHDQLRPWELCEKCERCGWQESDWQQAAHARLMGEGQGDE